jgi:acetyltransferase-like isoleucine patch superfamily enzyme
MNREQLRRLPWDLSHRRGALLASRVRQEWIKATHQHCTVRFDDPVFLGPGFHLDIPDRGTLVVGRYTHFRRGFYCEIGGRGTVRIGERCFFTTGTQIQCSTRITIGDRCSIGRSILVDGSHRFRDLGVPMLEQGYDFRPLSIGDDVTIHSFCTIVNSIGTRSVIASNAVVTKPIPAYCLAGGVPARVIEYFGPPEQCPPGLEHLMVARR